MNKDTIQNTIKALEIEANLISNGQSDKKNYNRLKNVINEWFEFELKKSSPSASLVHKYNIGDILPNTMTDLVKDLTPLVTVSSFSSLIIDFNQSIYVSKPYKVLLIDTTKNEFVSVVEIPEANLGIKSPPIKSPPISTSSVDIIKDFRSKLLVNIQLIYNPPPSQIVFDSTTAQKLTDLFTKNNINRNYNLVQFRVNNTDPTGLVDLYVTADLQTLLKSDLIGLNQDSKFYAIELKGYIDDSDNKLTIEDYKDEPEYPWMKGGAKVNIKLQVIIEKVSGPAITAEVDASTLSATSAAPVDPAAAAAAATATSTAGP